MAAYGLYTHIASNRRRSVLLLAGLFFLVYVMVFAGALIAEVVLGDASLAWYLQRAFRHLMAALPFATIATALWIAIAWTFHQNMIDAVTGAHEVTRQEEPRLYNLLENLCISRGIAMPKLKIMANEARNAFATGLNQKQYSITVTSGLTKALDDAELEAVLAHELTHIRNGDVRMLVIATIIAGVIAFFAEMFFRIFFRTNWSPGRGRSSSSSDSKRGGGGAIPAILIAVALIALAWFLSIVVRLALSRSREFLADAGAVELTKNPDAMIGALRKIESRGEIEGATSAVMEMCVDNPRSGFVDLFATHPSIDSRVKALVEMAGGRDPGPPPPGFDEAAGATPENGSAPPVEGPAQNPEPVIAPEPANVPPRPRRSPWGRLPLPGLGGPWGSR